MKKLSVITINYNTPEMTEKALRALVANEPGLSMEIILIDNNSSKKLEIEKFTGLDIKFINNESNLGFSKAVNQGLKIAQGEYILLLNSDVIINNKAISRMISYLEDNKQTGIIGPKFIFPDGKLQSSFGCFPNFKNEFLRLTTLYKFIKNSTIASAAEIAGIKWPVQTDWVTGGCMLARKKVTDELGGFDGKYFLGVEDIDFCFQAKKAGWQVVFFPLSEVIHYHGYSSGGTSSLLRLQYEQKGISYFLNKNFSKNIFTVLSVPLMHNLRINILKLLAILKNKTYKLKPKDATIAITYSCNSRCVMCNIWQEKNPPSLALNAFANLSPELRYINLSGGEPFLRPDLPEIVQIIKEKSPHAQIIISSNGFATELILKTMKKIVSVDPAVGVRISIDGLKEKHNRVRGIEVFGRAMNTIKGLKQIGVKNLGMSFTVMNDNASELPAVYDLSKELGVELAMALVQNSDIYFQKEDNKITYIAEVNKALDYVISRELASWHPKRWARAFYNYGLRLYANTGRRLLPTGAGHDSLFIDPNGDVYPSNLINIKFGNINDNKLDNIWQSGKAKDAREYMARNYITESWIICTIRGVMKKHILKVAGWALVNKLKVLMGKYENTAN